MTRLFKSSLKLEFSQSAAGSLLPTTTIKGRKTITLNQERLNEFAEILNEQITVGGCRINIEANVPNSVVQRQFASSGEVLDVKPLVKKAALITLDNQYLEQHQRLRTAEGWDDLAHGLEGAQKSQLLALKMQWMCHANLSHCTPDALFAIAKNIHQFNREFNRIFAYAKHYRVTSQSKKDHQLYLAYLEQYKSQLARFQKEIADALAIRIHYSVHNGNLQYHEPLAGLRGVLHQKNIPTATLSNDFIPYLSTLDLAHAYDYGLRRGLPSLKTQLREQLSSTARRMPLGIVHRGTTPFLAPKTLMKFFPKKSSRLSRFHKGRMRRFQWLTAQQALIGQLHLVDHAQIPNQLSWDFESHYYQSTEQLGAMLTIALTQNKAYKKPRLFRTKTNALYMAWSRLLQAQQKQIIETQLEFFDKLTRIAKPCDALIDNENPLEQTRALATLKLKKLHEKIIELNDKALLSQWQVINDKIGKKLLPDAIEIHLTEGIKVLLEYNQLDERVFKTLCRQLKGRNESTDVGIQTAYADACLKIAPIFQEESNHISQYLNQEELITTLPNLERLTQLVVLLKLVNVPSAVTTIRDCQTAMMQILESYHQFVLAQPLTVFTELHTESWQKQLLVCCHSVSTWKDCQRKFALIAHHIALKQQGLSPDYKEQQFARLDTVHDATRTIIERSDARLDNLSSRVKQQLDVIKAVQQEAEQPMQAPTLERLGWFSRHKKRNQPYLSDNPSNNFVH